MPAFYAGKRVGKPLMRGHTYNAMFNGKLVWPLDKDTVVSVNITDDKGKPLPKSLAVSGTLKLGAKATYADGHVGDLLTTKNVTFTSRDTSTATVSGNTLTWRHGGTILVTATVDGFTSAAVAISAAYAPESIKVTDDSGQPVDAVTLRVGERKVPPGACPAHGSVAGIHPHGQGSDHRDHGLKRAEHERADDDGCLIPVSTTPPSARTSPRSYENSHKQAPPSCGAYLIERKPNMGGIRVTGLLMGSTSLDIKAGSVTKTIPVTVKSRNLLSYGPAEGNGLTATVNSDGSLHVTGTATGQWRGLSWTFPCPVQGTVKLSGTSLDGLSFNIKCLDAKGQQLGDQMNLGNSVMAIPAGTVSLFLNVISTEATPTAKDGDLRIQLESGTTAHDWMRPDNTSLRGGVL